MLLPFQPSRDCLERALDSRNNGKGFICNIAAIMEGHQLFQVNLAHVLCPRFKHVAIACFVYIAEVESISAVNTMHLRGMVTLRQHLRQHSCQLRTVQARTLLSSLLDR